MSIKEEILEMAREIADEEDVAASVVIVIDEDMKIICEAVAKHPPSNFVLDLLNRLSDVLDGPSPANKLPI